MSFHEGSNWQAKRQDGKKPLYENKTNSFKIDESYESKSNIQKIEYWSEKYQFNFQFWGKGNNNVFISKNDVELTSFGDCETIDSIIEKTLEYIERINKIVK